MHSTLCPPSTVPSRASKPAGTVVTTTTHGGVRRLRRTAELRRLLFLPQRQRGGDVPSPTGSRWSHSAVSSTVSPLPSPMGRATTAATSTAAATTVTTLGTVGTA
jgi:hypothetical protein